MSSHSLIAISENLDTFIGMNKRCDSPFITQIYIDYLEKVRSRQLHSVNFIPLDALYDACIPYATVDYFVFLIARQSLVIHEKN